jgi:hypothetical protein
MDMKIDQLIYELDRAARAAEALKTNKTASDEQGIIAERIELTKAILVINELYQKIMQEFLK